jgi:hypothetical protein
MSMSKADVFRKNAEQARAKAWSPAARKKRALTLARKKAAEQATAVGEEEITGLVDVFPVTAKQVMSSTRKVPTKRETMAIQLLEMALAILKGEA